MPEKSEKSSRESQRDAKKTSQQEPQPHPQPFAVTEQEKQLIGKLRESVADLNMSKLYDTDLNLRRWLTGYNNEMEKIVPKLRKHLQYRKCMNLDRPIDQLEMVPIMKQYYAQCYFDSTTGLGNDDSLLQILCLGKIDIEGLQKSVSVYRFLQSRTFYTEKCLRRILAREQQTGKPYGLTYILDLDGFAFDSNALKAVTGAFKDLGVFIQENYVDVVHRILVVNAGYVIYGIWKLIQAFLPQKTRDKVKILSSDWKRELLQYVKPENLPEPWGGTMKHWEHQMVIPSKIPENFYYKPSPDDQIMEKSVQQKSIAGSSFYYHEIHVEQCPKTLKWYFKSEYDILFGVFYSETKLSLDQHRQVSIDTLSNVRMVFPKISIYKTCIPEKEELQCQQAGFYYLEFANEHYWFGRTVDLSVQVVYNA